MELREWYEFEEDLENSLKDLRKETKVDKNSIDYYDKLTHTIKSVCAKIKMAEEKMGGPMSYGDGYGKSMSIRYNQQGPSDTYGGMYPHRPMDMSYGTYGAGVSDSTLEHLEAAMRTTTDPTARETLRTMIERERMRQR